MLGAVTPTLLAPQKLTNWLSSNSQKAKGQSHIYRYHPRSDSHSKALCEFIVQDLRARCPLLDQRLTSGHSVYSTNAEVEFPSGRKKTLDLAIGVSPDQPPFPLNKQGKVMIKFDKLHISCEAKSAMTEHVKAKPRSYDELSNSHQLVHREDSETIACGITVVNIADQFASPLRQPVGVPGAALIFTRHRQPEVTQSIVLKLRTLQMSPAVGQPGFDAYATIVVSCDNVNAASLCAVAPSPQPGDADHYETFLDRIVAAYLARFP